MTDSIYWTTGWVIYCVTFVGLLAYWVWDDHLKPGCSLTVAEFLKFAFLAAIPVLNVIIATCFMLDYLGYAFKRLLLFELYKGRK